MFIQEFKILKKGKIPFLEYFELFIKAPKTHLWQSEESLLIQHVFKLLHLHKAYNFTKQFYTLRKKLV